LDDGVVDTLVSVGASDVQTSASVTPLTHNSIPPEVPDHRALPAFRD
jgi:hypothetical protein